MRPFSHLKHSLCFYSTFCQAINCLRFQRNVRQVQYLQSMVVETHDLFKAGISINIFVDYQHKFLEILFRRVAATTVETVLILLRETSNLVNVLF